MEKVNELIRKSLELKKEEEKIKNEIESLKAEIKLYLKESNTDRYEDNSGNLVTLSSQIRESLDKEKVKALIGELRFKEVIKTSEYDVLRITTKEQRDRLKKNFTTNLGV